MGIKAKENVVASRSKDMILEALISLMKEKKFSDITIKEVMENADLVRRTFYGNFDSKEDIIRHYFDRMLLDYINIMKAYDGLEPYNMALEFFAFFEVRLELLKKLKSNNLMPMFLLYMEDYMDEVGYALKGPHRELVSDLGKKYFSKFISAGLWSMLNHWIETDGIETSEELAKVFVEMTFQGGTPIN